MKMEDIENTFRGFSTYNSKCIEIMILLYKRSRLVVQDAPRGVNSLVARADMANTYLHYSRKKHQTHNNRPKEEFDSKVNIS